MFSEAAKGVQPHLAGFFFLTCPIYILFFSPLHIHHPHPPDRQLGRYDKTPRTGLPANGEFAAAKSLSDPRQMYFIPGLMRFLFIYRRMADPKQIRVKCTKAHPTLHTRTHIRTSIHL